MNNHHADNCFFLMKVRQALSYLSIDPRAGDKKRQAYQQTNNYTGTFARVNALQDVNFIPYDAPSDVLLDVVDGNIFDPDLLNNDESRAHNPSFGVVNTLRDCLCDVSPNPNDENSNSETINDVATVDMLIGIHTASSVPPESPPLSSILSTISDAQLTAWVSRLDESRYTIPLKSNSVADMIKYKQTVARTGR